MELDEEQLAKLAIFAAGVALGLVIIGLMLSLIEAWIVEADLADRRRIREILREMLGGDPPLSRPPGVKRDTPRELALPEITEVQT